VAVAVPYTGLQLGRDWFRKLLKNNKIL